MKPWFEREAKIIKFPEPEKKVVQMPNVASYPDFITGVSDLKARMGKGEISQASHDKLYTDLIHRFMRKESFETPWFLRETVLVEAVGISGRNPGDVFQNLQNSNDQISFELFKPYPLKKAQFDSVEEMEKIMLSIQKKIPDIIFVNQPNKSQLAFGLAVFKSATKRKAFIKYARDVQQVNNPGWWANDEIPGYKAFFKTAKKSQTGFGPAQVFGTGTSKKTALSSEQVVQQVDKVLGPEISQPIKEMVTNKTLPTFEGQAENETSIRDNLGEIFAPVALVSDTNGVTGPYKTAEKYLGVSFAQCKIFYPTQQANPLNDSYLIAPNGKEIGISSKGKRGANASIFNLAKNIKEITAKDPRNPLLKKHKFTVDVLNFLDDENAVAGPIGLAEKLKLINATTAAQVKSLWAPKSEENDIRKFPGLKKLYKLFSFDKGPEDRKFRLRFAILANLAKAVAQKVNNTKGFGEGALAFLNQSQIIQAYTQTTIVDNNVTVNEIKTIYPPNFQGILILNGGKNYYSTNNVGKIAFDFKPT